MFQNLKIIQHVIVDSTSEVIKYISETLFHFLCNANRKNNRNLTVCVTQNVIFHDLRCFTFHCPTRGEVTLNYYSNKKLHTDNMLTDV